MAKSKSAIRLTSKTLQQLKEKGFRYVLVIGYIPDQRHAFIELNHFTLVPVIELPLDPSEKEIYAPIDSEILLDWANSPDDELIAYIEMSPA